jgi:hypothetical protein
MKGEEEMNKCNAPCSLCWDKDDNAPCTLSWDTLISDLEFSMRADRICREQGVKTLRDLREKIDGLERVKGCGVKTIGELEDDLEKLMLRIFFDRNGDRRE